MNPIQTTLLQLALSIARPLLEKAVNKAISDVEAYYKDAAGKTGSLKKTQAIKSITKHSPAFENKRIQEVIGLLIEDEVIRLKQDGKI